MIMVPNVDTHNMYSISEVKVSGKQKFPATCF